MLRCAHGAGLGRKTRLAGGALMLGLCVLGVRPAHAQELTARSGRGGTVRVAGTVDLPNTCWIFGSLTMGAPDHAPDIANALPVTLRVDHTGGEMCAQMVTQIAFEGDFENRQDLDYVILYLSVADVTPGEPPGLPDAVIATVE